MLMQNSSQSPFGALSIASMSSRHFSLDYSQQLNTIKMHGSLVRQDIQSIYHELRNQVSTHLSSSSQLFLHIRLNDSSNIPVHYWVELVEYLNELTLDDKTIRLLWYVQKDQTDLISTGYYLRALSDFPINVIIL